MNAARNRVRPWTIALLLSSVASSTPGSAGSSSEGASELLQVGRYFAGEWSMEGRFRYDPKANWTPTRSRLQAESQLGGRVVARQIEAPQIEFNAYDVITQNLEQGTVQYLYVNDQRSTALFYEGRCEDGCRRLEFEQVCPAKTDSWCGGRTSITIESDDLFVARDFLPRDDLPEGEMMTREVFYRRVD